MATGVSAYSAARRNVRSFFGNFPQVSRIHSRLTELLQYQCTTEEPECLAILGETGTGKTTLLASFAKRYPRITHPEFTEVPVLYASVPARCTIKVLAGLLLRSLGSPLWNRGDEEDRTYQLVTLLKACKVRLILLDEVNHLADRGAAKTHYQVGDWIKQLCTSTRVPLVLIGTPAASILWDTNEQLADRYEVLTLRPLSLEEGRTQEFKAVLGTYLRLMEGLDVTPLQGEKTLRLMAFASGGRLRDIRKLLVRAIVIAEETGTTLLTIDTLRAAFEQVIFEHAPSKRNPFHKDFNGLPLTAPGEPFAPRRYKK